ncbi:MAG: cbb3-type cytochrome c oxidase N-terminal domain-containing protein [bacterium]
MSKILFPGLYRVFALASALIVISSSAMADSGTIDKGGELALIITGALTAFFIVLIFFVIFVLNGNIDPLTAILRAVWEHIVPQDADKAIAMDEDFDGITELDNQIPPWFNYLFAGSVVFALMYMLDYHVWGTSPLPGTEFSQEVAAADLLRRVRIASEGTIDENQLTALKDSESIKSGSEKFMKNCVSCHGNKGEGIVGPNLTDQFWIHGGGVKEIYATIKNGIPAKGMISWKLVFTPKEIQLLSSFILSLQGTNPPNAKKAEGVLYVAPKMAVKDSTKQKATS